MRLGGKRVKIEKMRGEPIDIRRFQNREIEVAGRTPPMANNVRFEINGDVPWLPDRVIEFNGETYIIFPDNTFDGENVLYIIDERRERVEYRQNGNTLIISSVIGRIQLAYKNQMLTIIRR